MRDQFLHGFYPRPAFNSWPLQIVLPIESDVQDGSDLISMNEPSLIAHLIGLAPSPKPKRAQKHRIRVDLHGLSPKSIKTEISEDKSRLIVSGQEGERHEEADFFVKELRRTFKLPENVETDKMTSFVTRNGDLMIEFPIREEKPQVAKPNNESLIDVKPQNENGENFKVSMQLPENVDASKIKVTCRDRDVVVEINDETKTSEGAVSQVYFYRRNTIPEYADVNAVKCALENNTLTIEAPRLARPISNLKTIPIENKNEICSNEDANRENQIAN